MKLDPGDRKIILRLLTILIILIVAMQNISVVAAGLYWVWQACLPVTVGFSIAFVLNVFMAYLEEAPLSPLKRSRRRWVRALVRPLSLTLTVALALGTIVLISLAAVPRIRDTATLLIDNAQVYVDNLASWFTERMTWLRIPSRYIDEITANLRDLSSGVMSYLQTNQGSLGRVAVGVTTSVMDMAANLLLGVFIALYMLAAKEKIARVAKRMGESFLPERDNRFLMDVASLSYSTFARFVRGRMVEAIILGLTCGLGMWILRLPHAAVISLVVGATALIPVAGAWLGGALGMFLLLLTDPVKALIFVIFLIAILQLESRFLFPRLVEKSSSLPGLLIICAVIIGGKVGGPVGMLIGVPLASILYELARRLVADGFRGRPPKKEA